jgi:hypothetical protein
MMKINYQEIPAILNVGTFENQIHRRLRQFGEIVNFAYHIIKNNERKNR